MTDFKPGAVAVATVRGVPNVRVMRTDDGWFATVDESWLRDGYDHVTDVRPLVVLDHSHIDDALKGLRRVLASPLPMIADEVHAIRELADAIEEQTRPPRIPEPGLWAVVEAGHAFVPTRRWVHHEEDRWVADEGTVTYWADLRDPVLVRESVEDGAS